MKQSINLACAACLFLLFIVPCASATDMTWAANPVSGEWETAANWIPAEVPLGPNDRATFGASAINAISLSASRSTTILLGQLAFSPGAGAFTITVPGSRGFRLNAIINDSGLTQTFVTEPGLNFAVGLYLEAPIAAGNLLFVNKGATSAARGAGRTTVRTTVAGVAFENRATEFATHDDNAASTGFHEGADAADATCINHGAQVSGAPGGRTYFSGRASAGNAELIATGGTNGGRGGSIAFKSIPTPGGPLAPTGGTAAVTLSGNAILDASDGNAPITIGSLAGTGHVSLGFSGRLKVGSRNNNSRFSGAIADVGGMFARGSLGKVGTGTLELAAANSYAGGTEIVAGTLLASHDGALGTGDVHLVNPGATLTLENALNKSYFAPAATLDVVSGATINLNFSGTPARVGRLIRNGVLQPPGVYGPVGSGAPRELPELTGSGRLTVVLPLAASRKTHGNAGAFDISLPVVGAAGIECRSGGMANDYQVVLTFAAGVAFQSASVSSGTGSVLSANASGNQITVNLTGITNAQRVAVTLFGANDGTYSGNLVVPMRVLVGDSNNSGSVGASDIGEVKSRSGEPTTAVNFRADIVPSDVINATDVALVKANSGRTVPATAEFKAD